MRKLTFALATALFLAASSPQVAAQPFWEDRDHEFSSRVSGLVASSSGALFAVVSFDGLHRSLDSARTWHQVLDGSVQHVMQSEGVIYAASLSGLFASSDGGDTWSELMPSGVWSVHVSGEQIVAGGGGGQLYYSADGGTSWLVPSCHFMPLGYDSYIDPVWVGGSTMLYRHGFNRLFASSDGATTWSIDEQPRPRVFVTGSDGAVYADDGRRIRRSTDGVNWSIHSETPFFSIEDLAISGDNFAVASFWGAAVSTDGGLTWIDWTEGLIDERAEAIAIEGGGHVYVATDRRVLRSVDAITNATGTSSRVAYEMPQSGLLDTPYPNPVRSHAVVPFVMATTGHVEIAVYDVLGRRLQTLVDEFVPAGKHDVRWSPRLSAGSYFLRMTAGEMTSVRPMTVTP